MKMQPRTTSILQVPANSLSIGHRVREYGTVLTFVMPQCGNSMTVRDVLRLRAEVSLLPASGEKEKRIDIASENRLRFMGDLLFHCYLIAFPLSSALHGDRVAQSAGGGVTPVS
jgi:hypothetical protein